MQAPLMVSGQGRDAPGTGERMPGDDLLLGKEWDGPSAPTAPAAHPRKRAFPRPAAPRPRLMIVRQARASAGSVATCMGSTAAPHHPPR